MGYQTARAQKVKSVHLSLVLLHGDSNSSRLQFSRINTGSQWTRGKLAVFFKLSVSNNKDLVEYTCRIQKLNSFWIIGWTEQLTI